MTGVQTCALPILKTLERKQYQAANLPKINLVAQYSLLSKYNNFQDYFARFQRHNAELGASFEIPILNGHGARAQMSQADADAAKLRIEVSRTRSRISSDVRRAWQDIRHAEAARDLARADLDLSRDQIAYDLALMEEGRLLQAVLEQDRAVENEKWLSYYQAQHALDLAKLDVLKSTGSLIAALR